SSRFVTPAEMPAATPTSSATDSATSQGDGPTVASRAPPIGPPDSAASTPATSPLVMPVRNPHSGAASYDGDGEMRATITPATAPAANGTAITAIIHAGTGPLSGRAPSIGRLGTVPSCTPVGATRVSAPIANPGPAM